MKDITHYTNETMNVFDEMRRSFQNFFSDISTVGRTYPAVDVREEDDHYTVEAELAGLSEKDIDVSVHNNVLTISSIHSEYQSERRAGYIMHERRKESFKRSFTLPDDADSDHINATFSQGLLTLTVPKIESDMKTKKIKIHKNEGENEKS